MLSEDFHSPVRLCCSIDLCTCRPSAARFWKWWLENLFLRSTPDTQKRLDDDTGVNVILLNHSAINVPRFGLEFCVETLWQNFCHRAVAFLLIPSVVWFFFLATKERSTSCSTPNFISASTTMPITRRNTKMALLWGDFPHRIQV